MGHPPVPDSARSLSCFLTRRFEVGIREAEFSSLQLSLIKLVHRFFRSIALPFSSRASAPLPPSKYPLSSPGISLLFPLVRGKLFGRNLSVSHAHLKFA